MKVRKSLLIGGAIATLGVTGLTTAGMASAATTSSSTSLVDKIASKFNLNKADVQAVFDEDKTARQAEMHAEQSARLQTAVDNGDITAAQKTLIENKQKELQAARDKEQTALEKWAEGNKIDAKYVMFGGRHGDDSDRLQAAVDDGDITAAQKKLIEDKQAELEKTRDAARDELEKWAEDNDIDQKYIHGFGGGHHDGPGGPGGRM